MFASLPAVVVRFCGSKRDITVKMTSVPSMPMTKWKPSCWP